MIVLQINLVQKFGKEQEAWRRKELGLRQELQQSVKELEDWRRVSMLNEEAKHASAISQQHDENVPEDITPTETYAQPDYQVGQHMTQVLELKSQLAKASGDSETLKIEKSTHLSLIQALQTEEKSLRERVAELESLLRAGGVRDHSIKQQQQVQQQLVHDISKKISEVGELSEQNRLLTNQLADREADLSEKERQLAKARDAHLEQKKALEADLRGQQVLNSDLTGKLMQKREECSALIEEKESIQVELNLMQEKHGDLENEMKRMRDESRKLVQEMHEQETASRDTELELQEQKDALQARLEELDAMFQRHKQDAYEHHHFMEKHIQAAKNELEEAKNQVADW
jgi:chromosome segregation ATPase